MADDVWDEALFRAVRLAISDPGSVLPRDENYRESVPNWSARAVMLIINAHITQVLDDADEAVAEIIDPKPWSMPIEYYAHGTTAADRRESGERKREMKRNAARGTAREVLAALESMFGARRGS